MEAHGGYLCRLELLDEDLLQLAREALGLDGGDIFDTSLQVSAIPSRGVVRIAYDTPLTYGRTGAHWYGAHHALPRLLSAQRGSTIHAYLFDPEEIEQVISYGGGRRLGREALHYDDVDLPMDGEGGVDDDAFEALRTRWPIGRLAAAFGVTRQDLLALPRSPSALVRLDGSRAGENELSRLLPARPPPPDAG